MIRAATQAAAVAILAVGIYAVLTRRHMIRICIGLTLMESAAILLVVAQSWRPDAAAPIIAPEMERYVDPLPHALALTAIVIGASITALALALTVVVVRRLGTADVVEVQRLTE